MNIKKKLLLTRERKMIIWVLDYAVNLKKGSSRQSSIIFKKSNQIKNHNTIWFRAGVYLRIFSTRIKKKMLLREGCGILDSQPPMSCVICGV